MEEDQDYSLFGSPPPSPRGRSPSPVLALPYGGTNTGERSPLQNVGTIALPGSHNSEHPITPLALSMSYASRPPAQNQGDVTQTGIARVKSSVLPPRTLRKVNSELEIKKFNSSKKRKSAVVSDHSPPPEIILPDPALPPPANFLRSQNALLGVAGLVSGVKPSKLTKKYAAGQNSSNPIIIDDDLPEPAPVVQRKVSAKVSRRRKPATGLLPPGWPQPSNSEIIERFMKQPRLRPLIVELSNLKRSRALSGSALNSTGTQHSDGSQPKRRKLTSVPAGAVDWDVPYPFQEGDGPADYESSWGKDREKQLIGELVALFQDSARQASARKAEEFNPNLKSNASHSPTPAINKHSSSEKTGNARNSFNKSILSAQSSPAMSFRFDSPCSDSCQDELNQFLASMFPAPTSTTLTVSTNQISATDDTSTSQFQDLSSLQNITFSEQSSDDMQLLYPSDFEILNVGQESVAATDMSPLSPIDLSAHMMGAASETAQIESSASHLWDLSTVPSFDTVSTISDNDPMTPVSMGYNLSIPFSLPNSLQDVNASVLGAATAETYDMEVDQPAGLASRCTSIEPAVSSRLPDSSPPKDKIQNTLQRAKQMREELVKSIEEARVEYWNTTIEHDVLSALASHYRAAGSS